MKPAEEPAGLAIADELGGKLVPRDGPGAPDRTHDFDIELGVGKTVSLEVTASVDEGKLRKAKPLEMGWGQTGLKGNWVLVIDDHARPSVRRFKKEALQLLLALEHGGIANLDVDEPDSVAPMADALREQMRALGIGAAVSDPRSTPAGNVAVWTLEVDSVLRDLNRLNELVEHEIRENIAKLAVTNGDERHLFIWIDPSQTDIELSIYAGVGPPDVAPAIPPNLDAVWVATHDVDGGVRRLWKVTSADGWKAVR